MYDDPSWFGGSLHTQSDRISDHPDSDCAPAATDAGTLLAAVALSSRAFREVLGHPAGAGADG